LIELAPLIVRFVVSPGMSRLPVQQALRALVGDARLVSGEVPSFVADGGQQPRQQVTERLGAGAIVSYHERYLVPR
jgi:hypothetical protein